jgi:hypothetical protein
MYKGKSASEERYAFTAFDEETSTLQAGDVIKIRGKLYIYSNQEIIDRGGNDPTAYWMYDVETGEKKGILAYGKSGARPTVVKPKPADFVYKQANE